MNPRDNVAERLNRVYPRLLDLSHRIHRHPETGFEEVNAAAWLAGMLQDEGFHVEVGICGLPTAFAARAGNGPLNIAICAEYDALPGSATPAGTTSSRRLQREPESPLLPRQMMSG